MELTEIFFGEGSLSVYWEEVQEQDTLKSGGGAQLVKAVREQVFKVLLTHGVAW